MIDDETPMPQRGTGIWNEIENRVNLRMCEESVKKDAHHLVFVLTTVFVLLYPLSFEIWTHERESRHIPLNS